MRVGTNHPKRKNQRKCHPSRTCLLHQRCKRPSAIQVEGVQMNFYQDPAPVPFVTVGNTGSHQPQLQQSIKSHLLQEQYIAELKNRLRALWDKYDGDRKHYMERIQRLEEAGDEMDDLLEGKAGKWNKAKNEEL